MTHCKYHPIQAATYHCTDCNIECCDQCIDIDRKNAPRCIHCQHPLDSLGASNSAIPFWRRLPETFRYPVNTETGILLVVVSFLTSVLGYVPLGLLWVLMLSGAFFKYSMSCLEKTAQGDMSPPDISSAYGGGLSLLFQLFLILAVMAGVTIGAYTLFGSAIGGLLGTFLVIALPAVMINFAITESVGQALNPGSAVRIIKAVGLPYGILMGFILIMFSSVSVIGSWLGDEPSVWLSTLHSLVSNYYTLVVFHMMGYMIFQYQREFGFYARHRSHSDLVIPTDLERLRTKIDINLKEGQFDQVLHLYSQGLKSYPGDSALYSGAFNFICGIKHREHIGSFSDGYFLHLKSIQRLDLIRSVYKRTLLIDSAYVPNRPLVRHLVAKSCFDCGDYNQSIKLLNGLHKHHPDYFDLTNAYLLMADALEQLPQLADKADPYRRLAEKIQRQPIPAKNKSLDTSAQQAMKKTSNNVDAHSAVNVGSASFKPTTSPLHNVQETLNAERRAKTKLVAAERQQKEQAQQPELNSTDDRRKSATSRATAANVKLPRPKQEQTLEEIFAARAKSDQDSDVFDFSEPETDRSDIDFR